MGAAGTLWGATPSIGNVRQIGLQLREIEAGRKVSLLCFRREDGIGLVDAFIPPRPRSLLCISPCEHGDTGRVVGNGVHCMAVGGKRTRSPGLAGIELGLSVFLNLKAEVNTTE